MWTLLTSIYPFEICASICGMMPSILETAELTVCGCAIQHSSHESHEAIKLLKCG